MLETRGLTRLFGDIRAVDAVDLTVRPGGLTGFVGGNGAGKTTTMRMIMGILEPTAGEVLWRGRPASRDDRARFGYMPEERGLYPKQPVLFQLVYLGRLHGMSARAARRSGHEYLERFGLADRANDTLESLSLGNQQRVQIAAAVMPSTRWPTSCASRPPAAYRSSSPRTSWTSWSGSATTSSSSPPVASSPAARSRTCGTAAGPCTAWSWRPDRPVRPRTPAGSETSPVWRSSTSMDRWPSSSSSPPTRPTVCCEKRCGAGRFASSAPSFPVSARSTGRSRHEHRHELEAAGPGRRRRRGTAHQRAGHLADRHDARDRRQAA